MQIWAHIRSWHCAGHFPSDNWGRMSNCFKKKPAYLWSLSGDLQLFLIIIVDLDSLDCPHCWETQPKVWIQFQFQKDSVIGGEYSAAHQSMSPRCTPQGGRMSPLLAVVSELRVKPITSFIYSKVVGAGVIWHKHILKLHLVCFVVTSPTNSSHSPPENICRQRQEMVVFRRIFLV